MGPRGTIGDTGTVTWQAPAVLEEARALEILRTADLEVTGRLVDASNATFYASLSTAGATHACVYKPVRGERPLWDFPDGTLAAREVAAYEVSAASGWRIVPPTVLRDGPFGVGMCQLWVEVDPDVDPVALVGEERPELRRLALFDAVVNNADRKGGHLLATPGGHVYGVDHGVCFHVEDKLRTVLWGWRGQELTDAELATLQELDARLAGDLGARLRRLLTGEEVTATRRRLARLLATRRFPQPARHRPPVPWPPF